MIVIADAAPLISLSEVHQLELLRELYHQVIVPPSVKKEAFDAAGRVFPTWVQVQSPSLPIAESIHLWNLGKGEAEAIALALELHANLILIDDRRGRVVAKQMGLRFAGTIAVLLRGKETGLISAVKPILDELISKGMRVSSALYQEALRRASENS